jgi:hypothetical protein
VKLKGLVVVAERLVTVTVLFWPPIIDVGAKVQVAPEAQERVMGLVKELGADALTVKVAVVVPTTMVVALALAESVKTGFPVPVRETLCPPVLEVILTEPVRLPVVVGVKKTVIVQLCPASRTTGINGTVEPPHVLVWEKSPLTLMGAVRVTAARLVLASRTTWGGLVTPTVWGGKDTLLGNSVRAPTDEATPVPVTMTRWGLPAALSMMVI